jgi:Gpi18-like mannosyltransferase
MKDRKKYLSKLDNSKILKACLIAGWIIMALILKYIFFQVESYDMRAFLEPWYDFIVANGQFKAFAYAFYDYSPLYLYMISFSTLFTWINKIAAIKIITILFEISASLAVYKIIYHFKADKRPAWFGFIGLLYLPVVFVQGGMWGQCDIIFTSFLLWMIYALIKGQKIKAILWLAIAIALKSQAMFVAPMILVLFMNRKIKWYWILLIPAVYFLSVVPAWLAGRPLIDLLTIYFSQVNVYKQLSLFAPNFYYFFEDPKYYSNFSIAIGLVAATIIGLIYLYLRWRKFPHFTETGYLIDACTISFIFPFALPLMHDRYFFISAVVMYILGFLDRKFIWPNIFIQVSSMISYFSSLHVIMVPAVAINTGLALWLVIVFWRNLKFPSVIRPQIETVT